MNTLTSMMMLAAGCTAVKLQENDIGIPETLDEAVEAASSVWNSLWTVGDDIGTPSKEMFTGANLE